MDTPFGDSNPPPWIWVAAGLIREWEGDEGDDLVVLAFLRYHGPGDGGCGWVGGWRVKWPREGDGVGELGCVSRG